MRRHATIALGLLLAVSGPSAASAGEATYVVRRGQTLSVIAHDVLGDPRLWPAIYRANRDQIMDPTVLHVGQRLAIPDLPRDPDLRERIRAEARAYASPPKKPDGPDVAAAPPGQPQGSATE